MKKEQQRRRLAGIAAAALATFALAVPAVSAERKAAPAKGEIRVPVAGMQVSIDPSTGKLRQPTSAEARALAKALKAVAAPVMGHEVQVTEHADGMLSAQLSADFLNIWVATLNPDGSLSHVCIDGAQASDSAPALEER
jgi:hypothetical protein